jgi:hypothetical protein
LNRQKIITNANVKKNRPVTAFVNDGVKPPYGVKKNRGYSAKRPTTYYYKEKPDLTTNEFFMKELMDSEKYAEQRETFKRLAKVNKGTTDMS